MRPEQIRFVNIRHREKQKSPTIAGRAFFCMVSALVIKHLNCRGGACPAQSGAAATFAKAASAAAAECCALVFARPAEEGAGAPEGDEPVGKRGKNDDEWNEMRDHAGAFSTSTRYGAVGGRLSWRLRQTLNSSAARADAHFSTASPSSAPPGCPV